MLKKTSILGVDITTSKPEEILEFIVEELQKEKGRRKKLIIFTPNPEMISEAHKDKRLRDVLNQAQISLPDGVGVIVAGKLLGKPIQARIAGVDFMKNLVKSVSKQPVNTGFLGGLPGVAKEAADCLKEKYPKLRVAYASDTFDKPKMIHSDIDILFVAYGFPKQEQWILKNINEIPAAVVMGVGGTFDFIAGRVPRAPKIIRDIGLEWMFRLIIQPWRIRRQARLLHFGGLILREALSNRLKLGDSPPVGGSV